MIYSNGCPHFDCYNNISTIVPSDLLLMPVTFGISN